MVYKLLIGKMDFKGTVMLDLFSMDNETIVVDKNKVKF